MTEPSDLPYTQPGHLVAGKYRVERVLGVGGMGIVVKANHELLDEPVALKFLLPDFAAKPEWVARFVREAKAARRIKGEHVTHIHDVAALEDGSPFIVMEFLEGNDAEELLQARQWLPNDEAADIIIHVCAALSEAHASGIVHRDLKPANIFRTKTSGGRVVVKVLDFGISKLASDEAKGLTNTSAVIGSALYMSPEQLQSSRDVDLRTDIYALGVTLYQLLSGGFPFHGDTMPQLVGAILTRPPVPLSQLRPDLPPELVQVVHRAFAHKAEDRFPSASELAAALAPFATSEGKALARRLAPTIVAPSTAPQPARATAPSVGQISETEFFQVPLASPTGDLFEDDPTVAASTAAAPSAPGLQSEDISTLARPAHESSPGMAPVPQVIPPMSAQTAGSMSREAIGSTAPGSKVPLLAGMVSAAILMSAFAYWFFGTGGESTADTTPTVEESNAAVASDSPDVSPEETAEEPADQKDAEDAAARASSAPSASASAPAAVSATAAATGASEPVAPKPPVVPRSTVRKKPRDAYNSRQ